MPKFNVRAVASLCLIEWLADPAAEFSADAIGLLLKKHAPQEITIAQRMHTFLILASMMKFMVDTTATATMPTRTNHINEVTRAGYNLHAFGLGNITDVKA